MTKLLVSVRGSTEALAAARGGAAIIDVEFPASALGTPYPLNIKAVKNTLETYGQNCLVVTNIGEEQHGRSSACQAALGVATAGVDAVKCGLALLPLQPAMYLGKSIVRTVREWYPDCKVIPAIFADEYHREFLNPMVEGLELAKAIKADGLLIDTFDKTMGKGLLDYYKLDLLAYWTEALHKMKIQAWVAGSITKEEIAPLSSIGVDVICVRKAACKPGKKSDRFGDVTEEMVRALVSEIQVKKSPSKSRKK